MNILGWLLAFVGIIGVIIGFLQKSKGAKLASAPFRRPSEISQMGPSAADPKGMVSTEGQVNLGPQPLYAPMSGEPCIAYEVTIERKYEKTTYGENGASTSSGSDSLMTEFKGSLFQITDGGGGIMVDATKRPDTSFETSGTHRMPVGMMIPGALQFGRMQMNTPMITGEGVTKEFVGTEKIIRPTPTMFAMGQLGNGPNGPQIATPAGLGTGKLMLSAKGRDALLGSTAKNAKLGFIIGGVLFVAGTLLGIFGPSASGGGGGCNFTNAGSCSGRIHNANGETYSWQVTQPGMYALRVNVPTSVRYPMDPTLEVLLNGQRVAFDDDGGGGRNSLITQMFPAGAYQLRVRAFGGTVPRGGYSFEMSSVSMGGATASVPGMTAAMDPSAAMAAASAMGAAASAMGAMSAAPPAGPNGLPADAPTPSSEACARAMRCCLAWVQSVGGGPTGCYALANVNQIACTANITSYRNLIARTNPTGAAALCP